MDLRLIDGELAVRTLFHPEIDVVFCRAVNGDEIRAREVSIVLFDVVHLVLMHLLKLEAERFHPFWVGKREYPVIRRCHAIDVVFYPFYNILR